MLGLLHALLLYTGDILVTYAVLGTILLLLRNASDKVLLSMAVTLVLSTVILVALGGVVVSGLSGDATITLNTSAENARIAATYRGSPITVIGERIR